MHVTICGSRGSVPSPGAERLRYGGDTSCVQLALSDGTHLILDAGTGIRNVPEHVTADGEHAHILLTHLHLDHTQGLLFFAPLFDAQARVTIWGPSGAGRVVEEADRMLPSRAAHSGRRSRVAPPPVSVPVGFTTFPGEIVPTPRSWVEQAYPTLSYFNKVARGGRFAAWEEPELFATEIRAAFRSIR